MTKNQMTKNAGPGTDGRFDLEDRTFEFAKRVRALLKTLPRTVANVEDARQLVRASASVGANYIEANDSLGRKDFSFHIKISRKESKESRFFLRLLDVGQSAAVESERAALVIEASELNRIFSAILRKLE
jgi:four helix bundle protein